jgi:hypothetical protein
MVSIKHSTKMVGESFKDIKYAVKRFIRKIKNVFRWLPTIWKDEDYDSHFINEILIKKLDYGNLSFPKHADLKYVFIFI